ncbi:MAG: TlpA disulfide reductase family protein [Bacteroidetes bacterium]|nr:TlpA disulfide reductase family protein [Bacteroidota bacterium]
MKLNKFILLFLPIFLIAFNCNETTSKNSNLPTFFVTENSKKITFAEFAKDNVVFVNFWATWCAPCIDEIPDIIQLSNEYKNKNVKFLGISIDEGSDAIQLVEEFKTQYKIPYTIIIDKNQEIQKAFGGMRGIPTTFIIAKNGKITDKLLGLRSKEVFAGVINKAINIK